MENRDLLLLLWEKKDNALAVLAERFGHRLQRLAENILHNSWDAQECVNDTYLAAWNTIPPHRPDPLAPYILRLCKNISVSRLRSLTAQKRGSYEMALDELSEVVGNRSLEETFSARELGRSMDRFLDSISKENRLLFLRRYWFGDSVTDLAQQFSLSENAVSARLSRIRSQLKAYLKKEGYYE